jgi:hypothetical protein
LRGEGVEVSLRTEGPSGVDREKRRLLLYAGGLVSVVLLWMFLIFFLGVGSGAGGSEAAGARGDGGSGGGLSGGRAGDGDLESTASEADRGEKDYDTPEDPEAFVEREGAEDRRAQHEPPTPPGGATDEPGGHDPMGIQNQEVPLTPADEDRVEGAAARFVAAAYGYSGKDRDEYLDALNALLVPQNFYASPGSEEIERLSEQVETTGTKGAARMSAFKIERVGRKRVEGYAYFETADSYDRYGELVGNEKRYRQRLTLIRSDAIFLVEAAGKVQGVRGR